ncbi:hypothetical protein [Buttiauxella sp. A111]|uniref:hypothetical protein n=1 Tax=Buttiauxella sp. A111 TaxID=2563088 RepID=UPI0010DDCE52|nr:hypothetical protein [Buttiauxella sp. A111]GDX06620.1 hypothetical protein BSPA111_28310 [Buttiauxella sp. A111]
MKNINEKIILTSLVLLIAPQLQAMSLDSPKINLLLTAGPLYYGKISRINHVLCNPSAYNVQKRIAEVRSRFLRTPNSQAMWISGEADAQKTIDLYHTLWLANKNVADIFRKQTCLILKDI